MGFHEPEQDYRAVGTVYSLTDGAVELVGGASGLNCDEDRHNQSRLMHLGKP